MTSERNGTYREGDIMRIVFMGTPDFAQICLRALVEAELNVVAAARVSNGSSAGEGVCTGRGD